MDGGSLMARMKEETRMAECRVLFGKLDKASKEVLVGVLESDEGFSLTSQAKIAEHYGALDPVDRAWVLAKLRG